MQNKNVLKYLLETTEGPETINSYAQLIKLLSGTEIEDVENLLTELENYAFIEDEAVLYHKLPMAVYYKQLPVVVNSDVLVKVVILQQADGLALIVPEHVTQSYQDLIEDPELLTEKNTGLSLYAEVYNLDTSDVHLQDIIKATYISAGNELKPFELKDDLAKQEKDKDQEDEQSQRKDSNFGDMPAFDEIEDSLPEMEEVQVNEEAYKRFRKQSNIIEKFVEKLYTKSNSVLKSNVRVKFFNKVLVIEVNNKNVYKVYEKMPVAAKKLLSNFGEAIRKNKQTQLVDSFSKNGKRYFILAENIANNYWYVINEEMNQLSKEQTYIEPTAKTVVKLRQSSIRQESRQIVPYKKGRKIVFVGSVM